LRAAIHRAGIGYTNKEDLAEGYVRLCETNHFKPISHITLTFDPHRGEQSPVGQFHWEISDRGTVYKIYDRSTRQIKNLKHVDAKRAWWLFRYLNRRVNEYMGGKNYRRKWGRSYYGFFAGIDVHKSGAYHIHYLVDNWVPFKFLHETWNRLAGHAWTKILDDGDRDSTLRYVVKYACKGSDMVDYFFQRNRRIVDQGSGKIVKGQIDNEVS
jgi:hypothetical protein